MIGKLAGYLVTAGIAAVVDLGGFYLLFRLTGWIVPSAGTSWLIAALVNYALTSRFVFRQGLGWRGCLRFVFGASLGFALNISATGVLSLGLHIYPPLAKLLGIGFAFAFNFAINLLWVFKPDPTTNVGPA